PDGSVRDISTVTTSADGNTVTTAYDLDGDGTADARGTQSVTHNADGSISETRSTYAGTTLTGSQTVLTSADGLSVTTTSDLDGDGAMDVTTTDVLVLNADGSQVEAIAAYSADGSLIESSVTTTSADGRSITISADTLGDLDESNETLLKTIVVEAD